MDRYLDQQDLARHNAMMQHVTVDQLRKGAAREGIGASNEPILRKAERNLRSWESRTADGKEPARMTLMLIGLVTTAAACYSSLIWAWFVVYYQSFLGAVSVLAFLVLSSAALVLVGRGRSTMRRSWMLFAGLLCFEATVAALMVGFRCYFGNLVYYHRYKDMRTYSNVGASQPASSFNDANMFLFTEDTRIDPLRSVGYQSRWTGDTYCAAPIIDSTMDSANDIFFWAVGENCCLARSEYDCDDAKAENVRSALVVLEPEDIVRPFMRWAVAGSIYPKFENSIKLQEATYQTKAAKKIKLVRWSKDPIALQESFYYKAMKQACGWGLVLLFALTAQAWIIAFRVLSNPRALSEHLPLRDARKQP